MSQLWRFLDVLGEERRRVLLALVLNLLATLSTITGGVLGALAVGSAAVGDPLPTTPTVIALLVCAALTGICTWLESFVSHVLAYRLLAVLRQRLYDAFALLVPGGLRRHRSGELNTRVVSDVETLEWLFAHTVVQLVVAVVIWSAGLIGTWLIDPRLLLVVIPGVIVIAGIPTLAGRRAATQAERTREALGALKADVVDTIQGAAEILAAGALASRQDRLRQASTELARAQRAEASRAGAETGALDAALAVAGIAAVLVVSADVRGGQVRPAHAMAAMVLVMTVLAPASQIASLVRQFGTLRACVARMVEVLDAQPVTTFGPTAGVRPDPAAGVTIRGLRFSYPEGPEVLHGVDLDVRPGRSVALVGPSGCGKSTLVQLVLRLWTPTAGSIHIGGVPVAELTEAELRAFVSPVLQDVDVFHGTLADNIRLGAPDADDAAVAAAVRAAGLDEVVRELPDGLATVIGERGAGLSGGQRARLAIARALVTGAPVLILDEAVSHLDPRLEEDVVRRVMAVPDRAVLVVAHREATVSACDEVFDLSGGAGRSRVTPYGSAEDTARGTDRAR